MNEDLQLNIGARFVSTMKSRGETKLTRLVYRPSRLLCNICFLPTTEYAHPSQTSTQSLSFGDNSLLGCDYDGMCGLSALTERMLIRC